MDNGGFPDLSGVIGRILSNPEALQGVISTVAGLKNTGLFDGLTSFSPDAPQGEEEKEGENASAPSFDGQGDSLPSQVYRAQERAYTEENGMNASDSPKGRSQKDPFSSSYGGDARGGGQEGLFSLPSSPSSAGGGVKREPDRRRDLLVALRPYLCTERQERLDGILKILGLLEMARQLGLGLGGEQEGSR